MTLSQVNTENAIQAVPAVPRPTEPAHVIKDDAEAIAVAKRLAAEFVKDAAKRDRERIWPVAELDAFSQSGLWSINVPKAFGGPEVSYATLARVIEIISAADSSIGQIAQNHLGVVAAIRTVSDPEQQKLLFAEVLKGTRFGNAFSEFGSKRAVDFETRFTDAGNHVVVNGRKFYSSGALLAHLVPIVALDEEGRAWYAIAERDAPGLTVIDDWSSFGQRTTLSGTVLLDNVKVPKTHLVPGYKGYEVPRPTARSSRSFRSRSTPASPRPPSTRRSHSCAPRAGRGLIAASIMPGRTPIRSRRSAI